MSSVEEFTEMLDLPETDTDVSLCSTDSETGTYHEQMSPDLFSSYEEVDLPGTFNDEETSYSAPNAEQNNNSVNPSFLTPARRDVLATLARPRRRVRNKELYEDVVRPGIDQLFTVCRMTSLDQSENSVHHSGQNQVKTGHDLRVREQEMVARMLASLDLNSGPILYVNAELEMAEQGDADCLAVLTHLLSVANVQPDHSAEELLDGQLSVEPTSPESVDTDAIDTDDLEFAEDEPIQENDSRSFVVDNIDIYRHIHQCEQGNYHLHDVPFKQVIITGVITGKSVTSNSITQLEVDDGSAVVICLFDDDLGLPEHRNTFHKHLDSWDHNMALFRTDAVFDKTFHYLREYAKRLYQETPQSGDLNLGDEVTIIGKVHDSKNEGRVIYHKCLYRKLNLANRENCGYGQGQFAKRGRHF